jgi:hypothetical protein
MRNIALSVMAAASLLAACSNEMPFDPGDPRLTNARLEVVGSPAVSLRYGASADLTVRYVAEDGTPIASAPLDYAIVGEPAGSRLSALQTMTGSDGTAAVAITAGDSSTNFSVTVTAPMGADVTFNVAVSDVETGSIVVSMTYPGTRTLVRFDTYLFAAEDCASIEPDRLPTALRSAPTASSVSARPAFAGVAPGSDYTVVVTARTATDLGAFGCRENVAVQAREETSVNITLADVEIPPRFVGVWDLDNRFDFGGTLPGSVETFVDALDELTDDSNIDGERFTDEDRDGVFPEYGQDPGAFVTDIVMRQTCAWECSAGETYSTCSELDHRYGDLQQLYLQDFTSWDGAQARFTGGCGGWEFGHTLVQQQVNEAIEGFLPDFVTNWLNLAGDLARAINDAHIRSVLTINAPSSGNEFVLPMTHELTQMIVELRDPTSTPPGMTRELTFALADAGFTSLTVEDTTTVDGTTLTIPEHSFRLNWGRLVLYIYREVFLRQILGYDSTGDMLSSLVDCSSLGNRIVESVCSCDTSIPGDCSGCVISPGTAAGYCATGLAAAGAAIEDSIASRLDSEGTLTIAGTATGADIDPGSAEVNLLQDGMWTGRWGEDATEQDITGTFSGVRRP